MRILVNGMYGLGDNLYQLGFIRALANEGHDITVVTPWPELYQDIPRIQFQRPHTNLRTQSKNARRVDPSVWSTETRFDRRIESRYPAASVIPAAFEDIYGVAPDWGLRKFDAPKSIVPKSPYIIVRPVTARREWLNTARNPLPQYIATIAAALAKDYRIISVADLQDDEEWLVGDAPFADVKYHRGELTMSELFGLCQGAAGIVGGTGWIVPFAVNTGVPTFIVCGGNLGYNHPAKLVNHTVDLSKLRFTVPDDPCLCTDNHHHCNKTIGNLEGALNVWKSLL